MRRSAGGAEGSELPMNLRHGLRGVLGFAAFFLSFMRTSRRPAR